MSAGEPTTQAEIEAWNEAHRKKGGTMKPELPTVPASTGRVCIDFDGTIAEGVWPSPKIGKPMGKGIAILIYYASQGREVIVHTARPESHKERIFAWLRMAGLQDHVYDVVCGKPVADLYIDDKAWNPWKEEGESAAASSVPSQGSAPSKAASPSPFPEDVKYVGRIGGIPTFVDPKQKEPLKMLSVDEAERYTNPGAVNG